MGGHCSKTAPQVHVHFTKVFPRVQVLHGVGYCVDASEDARLALGVQLRLELARVYQLRQARGVGRPLAVEVVQEEAADGG